jgi:kinesin family protein 18/19
VTVIDPQTFHNGSEFATNQVSGGVKEKQYTFDNVFDEETRQKEVFENSTQNLIEGITDGYNATVFAYGATGAGKTYTMLGKLANQGIFGYAFEELFQNIKEQSKTKDFKIKMSFIEIYNETIQDLLLPGDKPLELREDPQKGIHVAGVSEISAEKTSEVIELLHLGNQNRTTEATDANDESSRSHALLLVTVEHKERDAGTEVDVKVGKFSLIDLAGSERASNTNNTGIRMVEGANINKSLLALGNCINLLYQNTEKKTKSYIPFRDSKLTRLLKESLGGNSKTVMIANISPASS